MDVPRSAAVKRTVSFHHDYSQNTPSTTAETIPPESNKYTTTMQSFNDIRPTPGLRSTDILYTAGGTIQINAPAKHVFDTILNFSNYTTWNRDTPQIEPTQESSPLRKGSTANMKIIMPDQNREYTVPIEILELDEPNQEGVYVLSWRGKMLPAWFGVSERVQHVRPVAGVANACEVVNYESMAGWGAYVFKYVMGIPKQMVAFNAKYLEDLKGQAEKTFVRS